MNRSDYRQEKICNICDQPFRAVQLRTQHDHACQALMSMWRKHGLRRLRAARARLVQRVRKLDRIAAILATEDELHERRPTQESRAVNP